MVIGGGVVLLIRCGGRCPPLTILQVCAIQQTDIYDLISRKKYVINISFKRVLNDTVC